MMTEPFIRGGAPLPATRRNVLAWTASVLALMAIGNPAWAQTVAPSPELRRFVDLSQLLTGYDDLDTGIATRTYDALLAADPGNAGKFSRLAELGDRMTDAKALRDAAISEGLGDAVTDIVSAWYTGTVISKDRPVVIAYRDALMYRPVEDGLVVPTYCDKGPMWWRDTLPPGITRAPVNVPKVL